MSSANANKHACELRQRKYKRKLKRQSKKWKIFRFLGLTFELAFAFYTCDPGQGKCKRKRKMKHIVVPYICTAADVQTKMASSSASFKIIPRVLTS